MLSIKVVLWGTAPWIESLPQAVTPGVRTAPYSRNPHAVL